MPVAWVVRTRAWEILVMVAFCMPMMKHRQASAQSRPKGLVNSPPEAKHNKNTPCTAMAAA